MRVKLLPEDFTRRTHIFPTFWPGLQARERSGLQPGGNTQERELPGIADRQYKGAHFICYAPASKNGLKP
jgi:hypothetical protein